jgi:hypothetical protein
MYKLPDLVLWTIYNYLDIDNAKLKFKKLHPYYKEKIILKTEYGTPDLILKYLTNGYYLRFYNNIDYFDKIYTKYKKQIYGCYINTLNELYKLNNNTALTHVTFNKDSNFPINKCNKLNNITHLELGWYFNQPIDKLPSCLTYLKCGNHFNQPVDKLPESLTHLILGFHFNQPVDKLPKSLTHIEFSHIFNQPVNKLPSSLTHIKFGYEFNQPVNNLPDSLTHLTLGFCFNQPVDKLPNGLKYVKFGYTFNKSIDKLPDSITIIHLCGNYKQHITKLPANLKYLSIDTTKYLYDSDSDDDYNHADEYDVEYIKSLVNNNCVVKVI